MIKMLVWNVRTAKKMSLRKLEKYTGLSRNYINKIENNKTSPTIAALCALARALQVPVTDLFEDTKGIKA